MILCVPVPVLIKLQLPLARKFILGTVFSLGILTVLTAILNRYYNFSSPYGSLNYLYWYVAESSTSIYVSNIPLCWPVLRRIFSLDAFSASGRTKGSANLTSGSHHNHHHFTGTKNSALRGGADRPFGRAEEGWQRTESEERIVGNFNNGATPWHATETIGTAHGGADDEQHSADVELGDITHAGDGNGGGGVGGGSGGVGVDGGRSNSEYVVNAVGPTGNDDDEKRKKKGEYHEWHRSRKMGAADGSTDIVKTVDIDQYSNSSRSPPG